MPLLDTKLLACIGKGDGSDKKPMYDGLERRVGDSLSLDRARKIFDAFYLANQELESRKDHLRDKLKRWFEGFLNQPFNDISVYANFREGDDAVRIRQLFLESSGVLEADALEAASDQQDCIVEEFVELRAAVLKNLAEVLARSGLGVVNDVRDVGEDFEFTEGDLYKLRISKKEVLATCAGHTREGDHFEVAGYPFADGTPFFEFDGAVIGEDFSSGRIGKECVRQEPDRDVISRFCGYDKHGRMVFEKLREELLLGSQKS